MTDTLNRVWSLEEIEDAAETAGIEPETLEVAVRYIEQKRAWVERYSRNTVSQGEIPGDAFSRNAINGIDRALAQLTDENDSSTDYELIVDALTTAKNTLMREPKLELSAISHKDLCLLSKTFNSAAGLRSAEEIRINEWLKTQIAQTSHEYTGKP